MQEQWDRCNYVVLNWTFGCVSQDVFLGQVFSKNAKTIWDELEETYSKQDAFVIFNMHYKIHSLCQSGALLFEYYHKFNALWRQYDSLVNLPDCTCANSDKLKEHNQLIKLMQFLMGLDEVYAPIRSIILTTNPIPDVTGAFATLSRDEAHRSTQSHSVPKIGNGNIAFVARTNNKVNNNNNNWSGSNNQPIKLNKPNLVCTYCNMNGYTADRCFELIGYPPNFKKNTGPNKGSASNNVVLGNKDQSHTFTDDQYKRLMSLISEKSGSSSIPANIAVVPGYQVSLLSVHSLSKDNKFRVIFDEYTCVIQDSVLRTQVGTGNESNGLYFLNTVFRSDNGTKFVNQNMTKFCNDHGILHQTSCAYTPQQNGIAERKHRHLLNVARTPSSVLSGKSPYEMFFKCEPNLSHLKVFGCLCFSTVLNNHDKFSSRSEKSVFVGYSFDKKGYKLFSLETKKIFYSRDVKFYETVFPLKNSSENKDYELELKDLNSLNFFNNDLGEDLSSEPYDDRRDSNSGNSKGTNQFSHGGTENTGNDNKDDRGHPNDSIPEAATCEDLESAILEDNSLSEGDDTNYQEFNNQFQSQNHVLNLDRQNENLRRSTRKTSMPAKLSNFEVNTKVKYNIDRQVNYSKLSIENYNFSTSLNKISEPKTYSEAAKDIRWIEAMNQEMEALNINGTWTIVDLPVGRKPIGVITGNNNEEIKRVKEFLSSKFQIKDLGNLKYFLGIEVLESKGPCCTPIETKESTTKDKKVVVDNLLSQLSEAFLRYLKNAPGKGISFVRSKDLSLSVYVHSDWAKCKATRKSVTGYFVFLGNNLVSWKSKKQSMLAKSSAEAEYRAMNTVTCEVIWINKILNDLNVQLSLTVSIHCDKSSAIQIAANPVFYEKTKHFEIELFFLRY
ncbi:ribonuclease H-like domain-containing protein [Tanacetum coccineum]|uniref:Ribonuclease H-like domain-containing protein n=1 Tax=Tanacetum coccineum TaxID=301880 RepID=A0ABQ4XWF2_9ASTR